MRALAPLAVVACVLLAVAACSPSPGASGDARDPAAPAPTPAAPVAADTTDRPFASPDDYRQRRERAVEALEAAIQTEAGAVGACRVVPTSEQACGGPTSFAVYSADASDAAEVERLAARIVALDERANRQFEFVSTCMATLSPTPVLRDGRCIAQAVDGRSEQAPQ